MKREVMDEAQLISLVRRAQRGDRSAFGELAAGYQSAVFAIVLRRLRNRAEAAADPATPEVSVGTKAKVAEGAYVRGGKNPDGE